MFKLIKFIIGFVLFLVIAVIIFGIVIIVLNRNNKPKKKTYNSTTRFNDLTTLTINVDVKDSYVNFVSTKEDYISVEYYASNTRTFDIKEDKDELLNIISLNVKGYQTGKWYNRLMLTTKLTKAYGVTVYVPDETIVNVETDNGNIKFEKVDLYSITAETTNGRITLTDVTASYADLNTTYGNIIVSGNADISSTFNAKTKKGKIVLDHLKALVINAITRNGNIEIDYSQATAGMNIETGKGNITGTIKQPTGIDYKIDAYANNGSCNVNNTDSGLVTLKLRSDNGNIDLKIKKD